MAVSDDFNRASGPLGSNWSYDAGAYLISGAGNRCMRQPSGNDSAWFVVPASTNTNGNMYAEADFDVSATGGDAGLTVCCGPGGLGLNQYIGLVQGTQAVIARVVNGAYTELARSSFSHALQFHLRLETLNGTQSLYANGTLVAQSFDTALTSGTQVGLCSRYWTYIDNFTGDSLGPQNFQVSVTSSTHVHTSSQPILGPLLVAPDSASHTAASTSNIPLGVPLLVDDASHTAASTTDMLLVTPVQPDSAIHTAASTSNVVLTVSLQVDGATHAHTALAPTLGPPLQVASSRHVVSSPTIGVYSLRVSRTTTWKVYGPYSLTAPVVAAPTVPPPSVTRDATIHALVGAQYGDLEFDAGKSVRWTQWFADTVFITDVNTGDQRYWVINWTDSFPQSYHDVTDINYFVVPQQFRAEQWRERMAEHNLPLDDDDWVLFVDASEGMSCDSTSLPNDLSTHPFRSYVFREITRATAAGQDFACIPYYVFLRHVTTNVTYPHAGGIDPNNPTGPGTVDQPVAVPYYLPVQGLRRLWKVSALKSPTFDWSLLDQPAAWDIKPGTGVIPPPYLDAQQGPQAVHAPDNADLIINADVTFAASVRVGSFSDATQRTIASQRGATTGFAWHLYQVNDQLVLRVSIDGTTWTSTANGGLLSSFAAVGDDVLVAASLRRDNGSSGHAISYWIKSGRSWNALGSVTTPGVITSLFDSPQELVIGATGNYALNYGGHIYWAEQHAGTAPDVGTVLWRFAASEHTTGTSYTDPRGRPWTLTTPTTIVHPTATTPAEPAVKIQIVSYAYAHWNMQDIVPPQTTVPLMDINNDDGFRMRKLISRVRPAPGVPFDDAHWSPLNDPVGLIGPWGFSQPSSPNPVPGTPTPPATDPAVAGLLTPLYDLTFRINLRDGLFYAGDSLGNIPLTYDNTTHTWVPNVVPADWHHTDTYVSQAP